MRISNQPSNSRLVDIILPVSIASLGFFINAMYFSFEYLERSGSVLAQVWAEPVEHALVMATMPLYIAIGLLYWRDKKTVTEVKKSNIVLAESNRMKDLFTDILRHDLLNPVNAIQNSAELMEDTAEDKELVDMILRQATRLEDLIYNASKLSYLETQKKLELADYELGELAKSAMEDMKPLAEKRRINIVGELNGKYPAKCNEVFTEVFINFLSNAIKYGPTDSTVTLGIRENGGSWRILVKDNGPGIPDEYKEDIFHRFERKDKSGVKGSGLGLAIVSGIVALHKGRAWVEDNIPRGSIFYAELPKEE